MSRSHLEEQSISEWALIATSGIEVRPRWFEASQLSDPNDTLNVSTTLRFPRSAAGYLLRLASDTSFKFHLSTNRVPQSPPTTINQPTLSNDGFLEIRFSCTITSAWLCAYTEQLVYGKPLTLPLSLVHSPFFHLAESLSYQWDIGILSVVQLDHQSRRASFTDTGVLGTNIAGRIIEDRDLSAPSLWYDRWNYPLLDHIYLQRALENYPRDIGPGFSNEAGEIVLSDPDATLCAQMYESVESATPPSPPSIYDQKTATSKNPLWTTYGLLNRKFTFGEDVEEPRDNKVKPPISIDGLIHISNFNGRMRSKSSHSSSSCISAASTSDSAIDMNYTPRSSISLPENNATNSGSDKARTGCRLKPLYGKSHSGSLERNFARPKSPLINQPITVDHLSCGYMPKYATQPKCTEEASAEDKSVLGPLEKHGYQIESIFYMESPPPYLEEKVVSPNQGPKSPYLPMDICTPSDTSREDLEVAIPIGSLSPEGHEEMGKIDTAVANQIDKGTPFEEPTELKVARWKKGLESLASSDLDSASGNFDTRPMEDDFGSDQGFWEYEEILPPIASQTSSRLDHQAKSQKPQQHPDNIMSNDRTRNHPISSDRTSGEVDPPRFEALSAESFWKTVQPWIREHFDDIFPDVAFSVRYKSEATIVITADGKSKVNISALKRGLDEMEIKAEIYVSEGDIGRSGRSNSRTIGPRPPLNMGYKLKPSSGASIGTDTGAATLGAMLHLEIGNRLKLYGLTSHHILETRTEKTPIGAGVKNGLLNEGKIDIYQPSPLHIKMAKDMMWDDLRKQREFFGRIHSVINNPEEANIKEKIQEFDRHEIDYGRMWSSSGFGHSNENGYTMDWGLIDIDPHRSDPVNFLAKVPKDCYYKKDDLITSVVPKDFFDQLIKAGLESGRDSPTNDLWRVHGVGAMSGIQDGYLSNMPSLIRFEKYSKPSVEWTFRSRYDDGLGVAGDSGSLILNSHGHVLGMVLGYDRSSHMTYFTPLHAILEDIKRVTKAEDVRLAEPHRQSPLQPIDNQLGMVIGFPEQCSTPVHTPDSVSPPDSGIDVSSTPEAMSNKRKSQDSDLSEESPTKKINYNIEEAAESILV